MCELLKSWLRANAVRSSLAEEEVTSMVALCRDILKRQDLFPARNPQSFKKTIADVHQHLKWQLEEVLEEDRSSAELVQRLISLGRNLVADTVSYLLLAPTDLKDTDGLPSLEVVKLWQSLPDAGHPMPDRKDPHLQRLMSKAWSTRCGSFVAALLRAPWCIRLFAAATANTARPALENGVGEPPTASLQVLLGLPDWELQGQRACRCSSWGGELSARESAACHRAHLRHYVRAWSSHGSIPSHQ